MPLFSHTPVEPLPRPRLDLDQPVSVDAATFSLG
jgi:hypothetical protein